MTFFSFTNNIATYELSNAAYHTPPWMASRPISARRTANRSDQGSALLGVCKRTLSGFRHGSTACWPSPTPCPLCPLFFFVTQTGPWEPDDPDPRPPNTLAPCTLLGPARCSRKKANMQKYRTWIRRTFEDGVVIEKQFDEVESS